MAEITTCYSCGEVDGCICGKLRADEQQALRELWPCEPCEGTGERVIEQPDGVRYEDCAICQGSGIAPDWPGDHE